MSVTLYCLIKGDSYVTLYRIKGVGYVTLSTWKDPEFRTVSATVTTLHFDEASGFESGYNPGQVPCTNPRFEGQCRHRREAKPGIIGVIGEREQNQEGLFVHPRGVLKNEVDRSNAHLADIDRLLSEKIPETPDNDVSG